MQGLIIPLLYRMIHTFKYAMEWEYFCKNIIFGNMVCQNNSLSEKKKKEGNDDFCRNLMTVTLSRSTKETEDNLFRRFFISTRVINNIVIYVSVST